MLNKYLLRIRTTPLEITEIVDRLKNNKIKYVPFHDFCFEHLKQKMCAEYDFYSTDKRKNIVRWFVTDDDAVTILISMGAVIERRNVCKRSFKGI